jgi:hypothetical protein
MTRESLIELAADDYLVFVDGFDDAMLGVVNPRAGQTAVVVYDRDVCVTILMTTRGLTRDQAEEQFATDVEATCDSDRSPVFLRRGEEW